MWRRHDKVRLEGAVAVMVARGNRTMPCRCRGVHIVAPELREVSRCSRHGEVDG